MNPLRYLAPAALAATLILAASGCGKAADEAAEVAAEQAAAKEGHNLDVNLEGGNVKISGTDAEGNAINIETKQEGGTAEMHIKGADGAEAHYGENTKLPADFPKDVPQYEGMKLISSMTESGNMVVQATLSADLAAAKDYYVKACKEQGWTETQTMSTAGTMEMLHYEKDDRVLSVTLMKQDSGSMLNLVVGPK
ncbi:MAG: hypothetical protein HYV27_01785 [Candidatus Hydrogenedentes bacterium]|nr:hypothetical protein [Candidatus Hydrogenedentota bacterium]